MDSWFSCEPTGQQSPQDNILDTIVKQRPRTQWHTFRKQNMRGGKLCLLYLEQWKESGQRERFRRSGILIRHLSKQPETGQININDLSGPLQTHRLTTKHFMSNDKRRTSAEFVWNRKHIYRVWRSKTKHWDDFI